MRRSVAALVGAALGCGALLGTAVPASAGVVEGPAKDAVIGTHGSYRIVSESPLSTMELVGPGGAPVVPSDRDQATGRPVLVLDTDCREAPQPECAGAPVVANGRWLIRITGAGAEERPFFVRIGGLPVRELAASLEGRTATVRWKPGPEPDVTAWQVFDDHGAVKQVRAPRDEAGAIACPEAGCSVVFEYPATASGPRTFSVQAARPCGVEACADVYGPGTSSGPVTLPAAAPSPGASTPPPAAGGATSAPPGGTGSGSSGAARGFGGFAPKLGLPKLPPLPNGGAPVVAAPQVADTFEQELDYGDRELPEIADDDEPTPTAGRDDTRLTSTGGLLQDEQVVRGVAAALVLGLSGAHLRTWLARTREEDELDLQV
ncbi:MAG TPA: hypothetical protein VNU26_09700 [Mycobacteriales bacterium]|nr:hypothetical protein [Mycobacteriales bacterium]